MNTKRQKRVVITVLIFVFCFLFTGCADVAKSLRNTELPDPFHSITNPELCSFTAVFALTGMVIGGVAGFNLYNPDKKYFGDVRTQMAFLGGALGGGLGALIALPFEWIRDAADKKANPDREEKKKELEKIKNPPQEKTFLNIFATPTPYPNEQDKRTDKLFMEYMETDFHKTDKPDEGK